MALVVPTGYGQALFSFAWAGDPDPMAVTLGVQSDAAVNLDVANLAGELRDAWATNLMPFMIDDITLTQVEVRFQLAALPAPPVIGVAPSGAVGGSSSNPIPQNTAYLVHKRSSVGGRGGRGRMYIPGCKEGNVSAIGEVDSTEQTNWNGALLDFLTDLAAAAAPTAVPVILHDDAGAYAGEPPYEITNLTIDAVVATQRRRLRH